MTNQEEPISNAEVQHFRAKEIRFSHSPVLSERHAPPPLGGRGPLVRDGPVVSGNDPDGPDRRGGLEGVLGQRRVRSLQGHARHVGGLR